MNKIDVVIADIVDFHTYRPNMKWTSEQFARYQNAIKKHIMNFGAIYMSTCAPKEEKMNWFYENDRALSYAEGGHALTIVGWDDSYSRKNFTSPTGAKPEKDGAYIALNSWGSSWGDNGYLYISYEDQLVHTGLTGIVSTNKEDLLKLTDIK